MKKIISICTLAAIVAFGAGYLTCQKVNDVEFLNEANSVKYEILMLQDEALQRVDTIMSNNEIYDIDGSDTMSDYLSIRCKIDSIYEANE